MGLEVFDDNSLLEANFSYFSLKPYVVTPHLNRLIETVQMRGHNICFNAELTLHLSYNRRNTVGLQALAVLMLEPPGRVAQSVGHLTCKSEVLGSIPGLATYFHFSFH